jgi:predicted ATPase/DNA-binding NarL/FixJ family response regulator
VPGVTTEALPAAGNLPAEPDSFVGRERDLTELGRLLDEIRVVTLCGPGGIGKTRLALRLAAGLAPSYPDGAWLADLGAVTDPGLLVPAVAAALGIRAEPDQPLAQTLTEALRPRSMLLVLDTCEHVIDACASLVLRLRASCPGLRVISTSREPLRVRGEVTWRVAPLTVPQAGGAGRGQPSRPAESEAVRLFADRAAAAQPGFTVGAANVLAVVAVCQALDGMPLAIELAAARLSALPVEQLAARLSDRFALLAAGDRAGPLRQQTLRATVDWSYDLLTAAERSLLRRLSVFCGWNLSMAEQICAGSELAGEDILGLLTALIDKSLVIFDGELNGFARYKMLDTVRQYAVDRAAAAGELPGVRRAHSDCMLRLQERGQQVAFAAAGTRWPDRVAAYRRALAEQANTRAALGYCAEQGEAAPGLRMCVALRPFWLTSGDAEEGQAWLRRMLAAGGDVPAALRARALAVRAELAFHQQDFAAAEDFARQSLRSAGPSQAGGCAAAWRVCAQVALVTGQAGQAMTAADAAIAAARSAGDDWEATIGMIVRAGIVAATGQLAEAEQALHAALGELGEHRGWGRAQVLSGLGRLARARGDNAEAMRCLEAALALYRQIGARSDTAGCLAAIGWLALSGGDTERARASFTESLELSLAAGQRLAVARAIAAQAELARRTGDLRSAVRLAGTAAALHEAIGARPSAAAMQRQASLLEAARGELGQAMLNTLQAEGRAMNARGALKVITGAGRAAQDAGGAAPGQGSQGPQAGQPVLTRRELQIAELISRGHTNAQIASELAITQPTAARHVANIFGKLGFTARAQVTHWWAAQQPPGPAGGLPAYAHRGGR